MIRCQNSSSKSFKTAIFKREVLVHLNLSHAPNNINQRVRSSKRSMKNVVTYLMLDLAKWWGHRVFWVLGWIFFEAL